MQLQVPQYKLNLFAKDFHSSLIQKQTFFSSLSLSQMNKYESRNLTFFSYKQNVDHDTALRQSYLTLQDFLRELFIKCRIILHT